MKKSEMIDKLHDSELYDLIVTAEDSMDVRYTLKKILDKVEENGMSPPFTESLYNPHTGLSTGNEWEKEENGTNLSDKELADFNKFLTTNEELKKAFKEFNKNIQYNENFEDLND